MNYETHGPGGKPHPQFILDYIEAHKAANGDAPRIWDRGNGWVNLVTQSRNISLRRSEVIEMTENLKARVEANR